MSPKQQNKLLFVAFSQQSANFINYKLQVLNSGIGVHK